MTKFEQFTSVSKRVLALAQDNAVHYQHGVIDVPHVLLALWDDDRNVAARVLRQTALTRPALLTLLTEGEYPPQGSGRPALTEAMKFVLKRAIVLAETIGSVVLPEHLLVGIVQCNHPRKAALFARVKLNEGKIFMEIERIFRTTYHPDTQRQTWKQPKLQAMFRPKVARPLLNRLTDAVIALLSRLFPVRRWLKERQQVRLLDKVRVLTYRIDQNPQDALLFLERAQLYEQMEKYAQAADDFGAACTLNPHSGMSRTDQVRNLKRARKYAELHELVISLYSSNLNDPAVRQFLGLTRLDINDISGALEDFEAAIALDPDDKTHTLKWRAWVRMLTGTLDGAQADCRLALERDPKQPFPHYIIGLMALSEERYGQTETALKQAIAIADKGNSAYIHAGMALYYARRGMFDLALKQARIALEDDPHQPIALFVRASVHRFAGRHDQARADITRAMRDWRNADAVFWKPYFDEMRAYLESDA